VTDEQHSLLKASDINSMDAFEFHHRCLQQSAKVGVSLVEPLGSEVEGWVRCDSEALLQSRSSLHSHEDEL
jgi:hypothetical protein